MNYLATLLLFFQNHCFVCLCCQLLKRFLMYLQLNYKLLMELILLLIMPI